MATPATLESDNCTNCLKRKMPRFSPQRTLFWCFYVGLIFFGYKLLITTRAMNENWASDEKGNKGIVRKLTSKQESDLFAQNARPIDHPKTVTQKDGKFSAAENPQEISEKNKKAITLPPAGGKRLKKLNFPHNLPTYPERVLNYPRVVFNSGKTLAKTLLTTSTLTPVKALDGSELNWLDRQVYPQLGPDGKVIPTRRMVHFDLKGAPPKPEYFYELFPVLQTLGATSILLEWEDMFPYTGTLASAKNLKSYTEAEIEGILKAAQSASLEIIPLVQTFGHLEWILKLQQFSHLRENPKIPQVICFGSTEGWSLITDMLDQVANAHKKYGLPFFHIGADEAFQLGLCEADKKLMAEVGGRQKLILWHISRVARYLREKHNTRVLAWHDMFADSGERDLKQYQMTEMVEPVIWNYAEDLNQYLRAQTWQSLSAFPYIWGASSFKGADGPSRYYSNPPHYLANHRSWMRQLRNNYQSFKQFRGIIMTGWSRFDHMALLCEILPVGFPSLAYNLLELQTKNLYGYQDLQVQFGCQMQPQNPNLRNCRFPGAKIYDLVQQLKSTKDQVDGQLHNNYEFHGWLSRTAQRFNFSSVWYLNHLSPKVDMFLRQFEAIKAGLKSEMSAYFYTDAINEFIFQYLQEDYDKLKAAKVAADAVMAKSSFPLRPFPELLEDA